MKYRLRAQHNWAALTVLPSTPFRFPENSRAKFPHSPFLDWGKTHGVRVRGVDSNFRRISPKNGPQNKMGRVHQTIECVSYSYLLLLSKACDGPNTPHQ